MDLDEVDRGILHLLQENARQATADAMGKKVGVSASTVRNRIEQMEEAGVIRGYHPEIDYSQANYQLHVFLVCRAPTEQRTEIARQLLGINGVVGVRELLTGTNNIHVEAVALDPDAIDEIRLEISNRGAEIVSTDFVKAHHLQPFNHFGAGVVDE